MQTLKTKCLIAYCHTILHDTEELDIENKGIVIIEDEDTRLFTRDCGFEIMKYCDTHAATRDMLGELSKKMPSLWMMAKQYYGLQIRLYLKYISQVEGRHIPILYAGLMFQLLHKNGIISLDIDYDRLITSIELSKNLETKEIPARFGTSTITQRTEINKYHNGVREILEQTMSFKPLKKTKKKKRK